MRQNKHMRLYGTSVIVLVFLVLSACSSQDDELYTQNSSGVENDVQLLLCHDITCFTESIRESCGPVEFELVIINEMSDEGFTISDVKSIFAEPIGDSCVLSYEQISLDVTLSDELIQTLSPEQLEAYDLEIQEMQSSVVGKTGTCVFDSKDLVAERYLQISASGMSLIRGDCSGGLFE